MSTSTINERTSHPLLIKLLYWFAAVAIIVIGIAYSASFSEKITDRAATGENASELNYKNSKRGVADPNGPNQ